MDPREEDRDTRFSEDGGMDELDADDDEEEALADDVDRAAADDGVTENEGESYDEAVQHGVGDGGLSPASVALADAAADDTPVGTPAYALLDDIDRERVAGGADAATEAVRELHPVDGSQDPDEDIVGDDDGGDYRAGVVDPLSNDRAPNPGSTKLVRDPRERYD